MVASRQEQGFELWKVTFFKLITTDKTIPYEDRKMILGMLHDVMDLPVVRTNMVQAFSNFMWSNDDKVQQDVANELKTLQSMIPKLVQPGSKDAAVIRHAMEDIIREAEEVVNYHDASDIIAEEPDLSEVGGDEEDNRPML